MANYANSIPDSPDRERLTQYLAGLAPYADSGIAYRHKPESGAYWKALDMAQVALHLSGVRIWATDSYTGGASIAAERSRAERYIGHRDQLTIATLRSVQPHARVSFMAGRLLVGLGDRLEAHVRPATHPSSEGPGELTATSMRFSDIDGASKAVMAELFQLPPDFDTEFVYDGLTSDAEDVVSGWLQDNETARRLATAESPAPAARPSWMDITLVIPS